MFSYRKADEDLFGWAVVATVMEEEIVETLLFLACDVHHKLKDRKVRLNQVKANILNNLTKP